MDFEPFDRRDSWDDPWDKKAPASRRRPEAHSAAPGHVIGSCESESPHQKRQKPRRLPTVLIAVVVCLIFGAGGFLSGALGSRIVFHHTSVDVPEQNDGDDSFSVDVDPGGDADAAQEDSSGVSASNIDLYTGDADFTLSLQSSADKTELTKQEIYARVVPSVVTVTVFGDTSGAYATGIVLSEDGFILTNQHVVGGESRAQVTTNDERTYDALLVGEDPNTDLAVLKIEAEGLTPAEFGRSDELVVGDDCYAIGNPLGITYRGTFSNGIISALNRNVSMNGYTMTLIQTTAALNSGNSGGPLINAYGQVIGVNNMKIMSSSTTVEGLGFAIPSVTAQEVANALISTGVVEHPVIGITCYGVTGGQDGYAVDGLYVVTVSENSDALVQGLLPGDIITAVNGVPCVSVSDVGAQLKGLHIGDLITLTVWRDGDQFDLDVALVEQNELD